MFVAWLFLFLFFFNQPEVTRVTSDLQNLNTESLEFFVSSLASSTFILFSALASLLGLGVYLICLSPRLPLLDSASLPAVFAAVPSFRR